MLANSSLLDSLAEQTLLAYQQQETERRKRAEEQCRLAEEQAERDLREALSTSLTPEFMTCVQWQFATTCGSHQYPSLFFAYGDYDWHLEQARDRSGKPCAWNIYTTCIEGTSSLKTVVSAAQEGELQAQLLLQMGKHRRQRQEAEEKRRVQQMWAEISQREYEQQQARKERGRAELLAAADAAHERLTALFEQASRKAVEALWCWPQGVCIEVYKLCYCTGSFYDQDSGATSFDYDSGWTAMAHLNATHRIQLEPIRTDFYSWSGRVSPVRVVQLIPQVHLPIWTVSQFASMEELPKELRESVRVSLPQVVRQYTPEDGQYRLTEKEDAPERDWYSEIIGEEPLPWVRVLIEQGMAR